MMSWGLSVNWEAEILRAQLIDRLELELAEELEPGNLDRCPFILASGAVDLGERALTRADAARAFNGPNPADGVGSNSWVLAGSRATSGAPLLANDMRLRLGIPAIWYENHLVTDGLNVTGITFPGTPGVISGHNGRVAWGFTNGFADVQDLSTLSVSAEPARAA